MNDKDMDTKNGQVANGHKVEVKSVKHAFTRDERDNLNSDLLNALSTRDTTEADFENIKQTWKAKLTEAEARIGTLAATLRTGFEMRQQRCVVVYRPKDRKKDFYLEAEFSVKPLTEVAPVLIEDMTEADFQTELELAEKEFECREEIELFPPTPTDRGIVVVGRQRNRWFNALRIHVGKLSIDERLDAEQRGYKQRPDAVKQGAKAAMEWLTNNFKDHAKGFEEPIAKAVEAHKERAE
jgi:hypothetical protein